MRWRKFLIKLLIVWASTTAAIAFLSQIMGGFEVAGWKAAAIMGASLGIYNAVLWPFIIRIALPFTVVTFGAGVLVLSGLIVYLSAPHSSETLFVNGLLTAIIVALGVTLFNLIILSALSVDDDEFYYYNIVKRNINKKQSHNASIAQKGVFFLEIDGLAHDVLQRALRDGNAPTMARWIREGSHRLIGWETDWSSQTGAMQAGILHGNNMNMPAFRWWEKEAGKAMVSNHPKDAMEIESRHSNGKGLLANGGASRANLLSGDAPYSLLTMSTVLKKGRKGKIGQDYYTFFVNPYNLLRTVILTIEEVIIELWQAGQQKRLNVVPRVHRGFVYSLLRAWTTIIQRDLQIQALIGDLLAGRPIAYTTFLGYDEVAHHSGIERIDALAVLRKIDKQFARLEGVLKIAPVQYELVVLSDHGQTQGETFLQRYGQSLEQLVVELTNEQVIGGGEGDESGKSLNTSLTEISQGKGFFAKVAGLLSKTSQRQSKAPNPANTIVMASGCLGLVYFNKINGRATLEEINAKYPSLIGSLVAHPGIGFVLVKSKIDGAIVLGKNGAYNLDSNKVTGTNPLEPYGENAASHIKRTSSFNNCGDLMINSTYWSETGEVAAFEELVGSHGGMGGTQNKPFVLYPSTWPAPKDSIIGAESLHKQLVNWVS